MTCKVKMSDRLRPVAGSIDGPHGARTGTCPKCQTPGVRLSIVGDYIRAHVLADKPVPANGHPVVLPPDASVRRDKNGKAIKVGKALSEPTTTPVDTGVRTGDPQAAEQRRVVELHGAQHTGTVKIPVKQGGKGRAKLTEVPATDANVRACLDYWKGRKPRTDASRKRQSEMVSMLTRWLDAMRGGRKTLAGVSDAAAAHRGPTLVRGRAMNADVITHPRERAGDKPVRPLFEGPLGRERPDKRIITVPEPVPVRSASQKRRERRKRCAAAHAARTANQGNK